MVLKKLLSLFIIGMLWLNVYAVEVIPINNVNQVTNNNHETLKNIIVFMFVILIIIGLAALILFLIVKIIINLQKKIKSINVAKKDFLYKTFEINYNLCNKNKDNDLKKRKLKTLFITWYRAPIYIDTEDGIKLVGYYDGETYKKENLTMIALYNKLGMFKVHKSIIIIPNQIKNIMKKEIINNKKIMILKCEGFDAFNNTDYYIMPLIKNPKNKEFIDFSDYIHKNFIEKVVYQDIIKENLLQYRDGIIKSVEMNPNLQFKRRGD